MTPKIPGVDTSVLVNCKPNGSDQANEIVRPGLTCAGSFTARRASRHGIATIPVLLIVLAISAWPLSAQRPPPHISDDRELKELDLTTWICLNKPEGSARTPDAQERNRLKNRSRTDVSNRELPDLDVAGFIQSIRAFDNLAVHKRRKDLTPTDRQQLDPLENGLVQVTGYLGVAYCGPPETTNCASIDFHDWHLEIFEKPLDHPPAIGDPTPIVCEITPRTQNTIYSDKVRIRELTAFLRLADMSYEPTGHAARKIRLTGYRLWDDEHNGGADVGTTVKRVTPNGYHNPWRQTAWEIHPVTKIDPVEPPISPVPTSPVHLAAPMATPNITSTAASPATTPTATPVPATSPTPSPPPPHLALQTPAPRPAFVTITRPVTIEIPYGKTTLRPGMKLPFVSRDAQNVTVQYLGEKFPVPIGSTDLR